MAEIDSSAQDTYKANKKWGTEQGTSKKDATVYSRVMEDYLLGISVYR